MSEDKGPIFTLIGLCEVYREHFKKDFDEAKGIRLKYGNTFKDIEKDNYIEEMKKIFSDRELLNSVDEIAIHTIIDNSTDKFLTRITITH